MASWSPRLLLFMFFLLICFHIALSSSSSASQTSPKAKVSSRKALLDSAKEDAKPTKIAAATTKIKKKLISEAKNQTKLLKPKKSNSTTTKTAATKAAAAATTVKVKLQKLNKTAAAKPKTSDSTKLAKPTKPTKPAKSDTVVSKTKKPSHSTPITTTTTKSTKKMQEATEAKPKQKASNPEVPAVAFADEAEGTEDLISEFRGLPARLQETLMPDLARLSSTSKAYLSAANAGIAEGVRPLLGSRWAPVAASAASVLLLLLPLCLLTALVRRMGPYMPLLRRALLFAQAYLAIYFATLALAAAATGLEPLRFFHAASPAAYAWTQAAQSLGYVVYLVLQMVDLVDVFSPTLSANGGAGEGAKALGLAQMVVGLAVGLHYYAAVFHRAAAGEAPRANWRVHAVYAACFVVVCACARAERRKKAYLAGGDGGAEEWKKS